MRLAPLCAGTLFSLLTPIFAQQTPVAPALTQQQIEQMQQKLLDWPNLARYRDENAKLPPPAAEEQRVVFMGDSITDGWGRQTGTFFPGKPYVNRGISGQTTPQMLDRFQQDVLHLHPTVVVILAGINDIAGNTGPESLDVIEDNFRSMVALAQSAHVRVVLSSVLPASYFPWRPGLTPAAEVKELNAWLEGFAAEQHAVFLNYYPALVNKDGGMRPELATDKAVHPNAAGYAIMSPLAEQAIAKALAAPAP
jgi:lysophospholipase L1-like esterase